MALIFNFKFQKHLTVIFLPEQLIVHAKLVGFAVTDEHESVLNEQITWCEVYYTLILTFYPLNPQHGLIIKYNIHYNYTIHNTNYTRCSNMSHRNDMKIGIGTNIFIQTINCLHMLVI